MSTLVELITAWELFAKKSPKGTVRDFCYHYLSKDNHTTKKSMLFKGMRPPDLFTTLAKLLLRISAIHIAYSKIALREAKEEMDLEWFHFMNAIYHQKEARKSDIINFNFYEQSTGTDILNRIKNAGYLIERDDPHDKRAKLISLSAKGEKALMEIYQLMHLPGLIMFHDKSEEDKELVVSILGSIEMKHTELLPEYKNKDIYAICDAEVGKEQMKSIYGRIRQMVDDVKRK